MLRVGTGLADPPPGRAAPHRGRLPRAGAEPEAGPCPPTPVPAPSDPPLPPVGALRGGSARFGLGLVSPGGWVRRVPGLLGSSRSRALRAGFLLFPSRFSPWEIALIKQRRVEARALGVVPQLTFGLLSLFSLPGV